MADAATQPTAATDPLALAFLARAAGAPQPAATGALNDAAAATPDQQPSSVPPPWAMNMSGGDPESLTMMGYPPATGNQPGPATQYMLGLSKGLTGGPEGVLSKMGSLDEQRDKAAADKMAAINKAMTNIQNWNQGRNVNLGEMAFGAGLLAPTRTGTFAESLGNGLRSAIPEVQQERSMNLETAKALGELGIQASDVELQNAALAQEEVMKRYQLAVEAGRGPAMSEMYATRGEGAAEIRAKAAIDVQNLKNAGADQTTQMKMLMQKYNIDQRTALGLINAASNKEKADAATTAADAQKTKADKPPALTENEAASLGKATYNETLLDPAWMSAKTDADKLKVYNAHRIAASLPPASSLPGQAAPLAAPAPAAPAPAPVMPTAPVPGAKPDLNSILQIQ